MSESVERFECPADGCAFAGNLDAVCGHHAGKNDADHYGGFQMVREHLTNGEPLAEPEADPNPRADAGQSNPDNPTFGGGDPDRSPATSSDAEGLELPCGHETIRRDELPELPCNVTCETCGDSWGLRP